MKTKLTEYKNGAYALIEKESYPRGMYCIICRDAVGNLIDKVRCDDYRMALDYYRAFKLMAKLSNWFEL